MVPDSVQEYIIYSFKLKKFTQDRVISFLRFDRKFN